ncbi:HAD family hydrolase [Streptomyces gardneri]|uniref:HAD family hydrolase n=1 Tax=Streptomyces gardneri TaxID=66892 RepID=UPI0033E28AE9
MARGLTFLIDSQNDDGTWIDRPVIHGPRPFLTVTASQVHALAARGVRDALTTALPTVTDHARDPAPAAPTDEDATPAEVRDFLASHQPAACVFDFDGTLVDTSTINVDAARATLTDLGLTAPDPWLREAPWPTSPPCAAGSTPTWACHCPAPTRSSVDRARSRWLTCTHLVQPVPRVTALARHLAATTMPLAVASANDGQVVRAGLTAAGLADLFGVIVAREHVTRLKPAPDAYLQATARLAVPPRRCLAFENTDEGIAAALAAGLPVIDVRPESWTTHVPLVRAGE